MKYSQIEIANVSFKNPVIAASGTFGFGREYAELYKLSALGGISTKGLTLKERRGNENPRIAETPSGIINSVGLQNPGVDSFIKNDLEWLLAQDTRIIVNVAGHCYDDYIEAVKKVSKTNIDMIELNISCPNVSEGGMAFGVKPSSVFEIVDKVRKATKKPLIVKLTPNVENIVLNAKAAEEAGADAISLINTIEAMAIDYKTRKPIIKNVTGGLSGPAVKPIALRMVWSCYKAVNIPIIGMGGISNYKDALEFIICGASLVQVGTANLVNPFATYNIAQQLENYLNENKIYLKDLIGSLEV